MSNMQHIYVNSLEYRKGQCVLRQKSEDHNLVVQISTGTASSLLPLTLLTKYNDYQNLSCFMFSTNTQTRMDSVLVSKSVELKYGAVKPSPRPVFPRTQSL